MMRRAISIVVGMTFIGLTGCGGDEASDARVPSMISTSAPTARSADGVNEAPRIDSVQIKPARPAPGRVVQAVVMASDPDGDRTHVTYRWQTDRGRLLGEERTLDTSGMEAGSRLEMVAIARDDALESEPAIHRFRLAESSVEVALVVIDAPDGTEPGAVLTAVVEVSGAGSRGAREEIEWQVNGEVVGTDEELDTTGFAPGDIVVVRAWVDGGEGRSRPVSSRPVQLGRGQGPEIVSKPEGAIEDGVFRYQMQARSPAPNAELAYELLEGPEGMAIDARSGAVEWRPAAAQRGKFKVEVAVKDQWGSGVAQSFVIQADAPPAPPARME